MKVLSKRLEEVQLESKRHFDNYVSVRNQLNELLEGRLNEIPPNNGIKEVKQDESNSKS